MKKRVSKLIISLVFCISLAVGFSVTAFADVVAGAGLLGSALGSLGIDLLAGGSATAAMLAPWLSNDFSIVGALTGVADGYIKVGDSSVTIDGVEYESIFLDPSMAAELHTQAFDFATQKAITDNSSGILATGYGYYAGVPMYATGVGTNVASQFYNLPWGNSVVGNFSFNAVQGYQGSIDRLYGTYNGNSSFVDRSNPSHIYFPAFKITNGTAAYGFSYDGSTITGSTFGVTAADKVESAFNYSYVAGTIDVDPLPVDYGFQAFVPSQTLAQAGYSAGTYVIDGGTGTDAIIELIQLLDEIYGQQQIKDAEFIDEVVPPVPPQPIDTPLGEIPYEDFLDTFGQSVYGKLDSISDGIDTVGQIIDGAGTDVIEAVDTVGQSVVEELEVIGGAIDTAGQSVVDSVEESTGILEEAIEAVEAKVDELVDSIAEVIEEIMTHPLDLFSAWLDRLPEIPAIKDIFDGIKRHVGIWHYVVEWLGCIGTFLAFFIGLFGDVAYCMVVPIYACVAGAICLAFYKRFAR